jgi:hypothetical protein
VSLRLVTDGVEIRSGLHCVIVGALIGSLRMTTQSGFSNFSKPQRYAHSIQHKSLINESVAINT